MSSEYPRASTANNYAPKQSGNYCKIMRLGKDTLPKTGLSCELSPLFQAEAWQKTGAQSAAWSELRWKAG